MDGGRIPGCLPAPLLVWFSAHTRRRGRNKRTVSDGRYEAVDGHRPVERHAFGHGLLSHEITASRIRSLPRYEAGFKTETGKTDLKTRASDVSPAIAIPTWSSIRNIFC